MDVKTTPEEAEMKEEAKEAIKQAAKKQAAHAENPALREYQLPEVV